MTTTLPTIPASPTATTTNDSARKDGGEPTEEKKVPTDQLKKIEKTAVDHTADEAGS